MADYEVDYSEVMGKKVECIPECGLCCLCQPEVLPNERLFFEKNHPKALVKSRPPGSYSALAMKKGKGSCVFLNNRRCDVYENRTSYCKQFPYHIYVGDKVKVELDLSCRGAWTGRGSDAFSEAQEIVQRADPRIRQATVEAAAVYKEFYSNCKETGVMGSSSELRMSVANNLAKFTDMEYLGDVMEASMMEACMTLPSVKKGTAELHEIEEAAMVAAMESMATNDAFVAPVYCDENWNWNIFMANESKNRIDWVLLNEDGDTEDKGHSKIDEIRIKPLSAGGDKILSDYVLILNKRESFMGSVFSLIDSNDYEDSMANAYYGCISTAILDVLWRASMLDHFMKTGMGEKGIREAIIYYDMDRLDAPAIGAFV